MSLNIIKTLEQFDENSVFFCDPIKNNIIGDGHFIRILYSNNLLTFNGIYLLIKLNDACLEKFYNKYKCTFDIKNQTALLDKIKKIEENLLKKIEIKNKVKQLKVYEQLTSGNIKIYCDDPVLKYTQMFALKISGIWETDNQYGLTFKFIKINHLL
jgi:hypothetical protein